MHGSGHRPKQYLSILTVEARADPAHGRVTPVGGRRERTFAGGLPGLTIRRNSTNIGVQFIVL